MIEALSEPRWQLTPAAALPENLEGWVWHAASFVERLKQHGVKNPEIVVLKEGFEQPLPSEQKALLSPIGLTAWIREVLIQSQEGVWMYARAVFPKATLTGPEEQFMRLGTRSLGSVLFQYPDLVRSEFEVAELTPSSLWHQTISNYYPLAEKSVWGRRSLFTFQQKQLLLSEVFLPDIASL